MNNAFYRITNYLLSISQNIDMVSTTLFAQNDPDVFKNNIYPLLHLSPTNAPLSTQNGSNAFTFEIAILDQRLKLSEDTDKLNGDFNVIDTFSTTSSIMNQYISDMVLNIVNDFNITSIQDAQPIYNSEGNGLDGWAFLVTIEVANLTEFC